ncbi:MAG: MFS transporter [Myxococcota bacterium]|nr:MFS transporter [Myxococcota bacterium]
MSDGSCLESSPPALDEQVPLITGPFLRLTLAHLLSALGFSSMLLLPLYLSSEGLGRAVIGEVMAVAAVGGLLTRPLVALTLDRIGRRPVLVTGLLIASVCLSLIPKLNPHGYQLHWLRICFGVGAGALFTSFFTFAADIIPDQRRTEGLALFGISGLLPLVVNPTATLLEVRAAEIPHFLSQISLLLLLAIPLVLSIPEAPQKNASAQRRGSLRAVLSALLPAELRSIWLITISFAASVSAFMAFSTVVLARRGFDFPTALWFTYAGGATLIRLFGARLPDRLGPARLVAPGLLLYCAGFLTLITAEGTRLGLLAGLFAGLSHGLCFPLLTSLVVSRSPSELRGSALSTFTGIWELSGLALTPLLGLIADRAGDSWMLTGAASLTLIAAPLWLVLERESISASSKISRGPKRVNR